MELKPCPFCGGHAEIWRATPGTTRKAWIACMAGCIALTKEHETDAEAVAAWNRRVSPAPFAETVAAYNAVFDPADEAGREIFNAAFRDGWLFATYPEGWPDMETAHEAFARYVDSVDLGEGWDAHRDAFFARLPLAALPPRPR